MQPVSSGHWAREKAWEQLCTKSYMVMSKNLNIDVSKDSPIDRLITISANIKMVSVAGWHLCFNWKHNLSNSTKHKPYLHAWRELVFDRVPTSSNIFLLVPSVSGITLMVSLVEIFLSDSWSGTSTYSWTCVDAACGDVKNPQHG